MIKGTPVFVAGTHRSGTSVTARWLASQPDFTGLVDTGAPEDEGIFLSESFDSSPEAAPGKFAMSDSVVMEHDPEPGEPERIFREWERYFSDDDYKYWVEKSPVHTVQPKFLRKAFPDAKMICIARHPFVNMASNLHFQTSYDGKLTKTEILENWYTAYTHWIEATEDDPDAILIRYKDLPNAHRILKPFLQEPLSKPNMVNMNSRWLEPDWREQLEEHHPESLSLAQELGLVR